MELKSSNREKQSEKEEMETKKVKLEPFYLSTVITYISSTTTFQNFRKISKNCTEAIKMLHTNPQSICGYTPYVLRVFPNINTLSGNINVISNEITDEQSKQIEFIDSSRHFIRKEVKENLFSKITGLRIDYNYYGEYNNNLDKMSNLRTLITEFLPVTCIKEIIRNKNLKLQRLVCYVEVSEKEFEELKKDIAGTNINMYIAGRKTLNVIDTNNVHYVIIEERKVDNDYSGSVYEKSFDKFTDIELASVLNIKVSSIRITITIESNECDYINFDIMNITHLLINIANGKEVKIRLPKTIQCLNVNSENSFVDFINLKECTSLRKINLCGRIKTEGSSDLIIPSVQCISLKVMSSSTVQFIGTSKMKDVTLYGDITKADLGNLSIDSLTIESINKLTLKNTTEYVELIKIKAKKLKMANSPKAGKLDIEGRIEALDLSASTYKLYSLKLKSEAPLTKLYLPKHYFIDQFHCSEVELYIEANIEVLDLNNSEDYIPKITYKSSLQSTNVIFPKHITYSRYDSGGTPTICVEANVDKLDLSNYTNGIYELTLKSNVPSFKLILPPNDEHKCKIYSLDIEANIDKLDLSKHDGVYLSLISHANPPTQLILPELEDVHVKRAIGKSVGYLCGIPHLEGNIALNSLCLLGASSIRGEINVPMIKTIYLVSTYGTNTKLSKRKLSPNTYYYTDYYYDCYDDIAYNDVYAFDENCSVYLVDTEYWCNNLNVHDSSYYKYKSYPYNNKTETITEDETEKEKEKKYSKMRKQNVPYHEVIDYNDYLDHSSDNNYEESDSTDDSDYYSEDYL